MGHLHTISKPLPTMVTATLVIRNASIIDGTGAPAFTGDVAIDGENIVRVPPVPQKSTPTHSCPSLATWVLCVAAERDPGRRSGAAPAAAAAPGSGLGHLIARTRCTGMFRSPSGRASPWRARRVRSMRLESWWRPAGSTSTRTTMLRRPGTRCSARLRSAVSLRLSWATGAC